MIAAQRTIIAAAVALIVLLIGTVRTVTPAHAMDLNVRQTRDGRIVLLAEGPIEASTPAAFRNLLNSHPRIDEVWLNSGGGSVQGGYGLGHMIRKRGLVTRVPAGAHCASACTDVFLGGVLRYAERDGAIGVHMGTVANYYKDEVNQYIHQQGEAAAKDVIQTFEQKGSIMAAEWTQYVLEMGASIRIVEVASKTTAGGMNWLTLREMTDLNIVNVVE